MSLVSYIIKVTKPEFILENGFSTEVSLGEVASLALHPSTLCLTLAQGILVQTPLWSRLCQELIPVPRSEGT